MDEYDLDVLELLWAWEPCVAAAAPAAPPMNGLGVISLNDLSVVPGAMSKNCSSSSSSSSLRLHQQKNKKAPAMRPTPATHPITTPAMPPPDKDFEPEDDVLSLSDAARLDPEALEPALTVVVTSTTELSVPLGFTVAVDTSVVIEAALVVSEEELEEDDEVDEAEEDAVDEDPDTVAVEEVDVEEDEEVVEDDDVVFEVVVFEVEDETEDSEDEVDEAPYVEALTSAFT